MIDFGIDKEAFEAFSADVKRVNELLSEAYQDGLSLINRVNEEGAWSGKTKDEFMAFMDLLTSYQHKFANSKEEAPLQSAMNANAKFLEALNDFYLESEYYQKLEKL